MIFEIGKFYRHSTGGAISVLGEIDTTMFGPKTLIAECDTGQGFIPVGKDESATANFTEISQDEWLKGFS